MTDVAGRTSHLQGSDPAFGHVTAVLVSHDGAGWLPQVLAGLEAQTRPPDAWVAVDTGSTDDSPILLADALGPDHVVAAAADTAYATAVARGLEHRPPPDDGWIWLLHDDSSPAPGALAALLAEAASARDIAVVGAKTREWPSLRRLLEVGVTLSGTGRRETGLEPGEPDQGQHDRPRDVLAVGTAGMLVRADVWRALGGLDPRFGLGDDLDLGWRVARAGHRVRVAPEAVVFHVEAATRGLRTSGSLPGPVRRERRRAALLVLLANCRRTVLPVQLVRLLVGSLLRALGLLLLKAPRDAWSELRAVAGVYSRPLTLWRARRARRRTATVSPGEVRHLLPPVWAPYRSGIARVAEVVTTVLGSRPAPVPRGSSETGPVAEEAEGLPAEPGLLSRLAARPLATTSAALLLVTLLALRGLLTGGELQGGALLPAPDGSGVWWAEYVGSWHPVGVGSTADAPAYAPLLAGLGVLTLGDAGVLVSLLLVLAVPTSALSAHLLLRRLGVAKPARLWAAVAYAALPLLTGALAQGRLGTVLATAWLPVVAASVLGLARSRPGAEGRLQRWTRRMRAGLALGVLVALVPVAYLLALVVAVGLLGASLRAGPALRPASAALSGLVVLAVPWLVAPWWLLDRMQHPANWWWEAGLPDAGVGAEAPGVAALALGQPAGGATVGLVGWLGVGVVLAALLALLRADSRPTVATAWCVAAAGLVLASMGAGRTVDLPGGAAPVWVGFCLVVWWGGLLVAAAAVAGDLREQLSGRSFGWRQPTVVVVALAAAVGPPLALAVQVADGVDGPLHRAAASPLPSYLADDAQSGLHTATLLIDGSLTAGLGLTLVREDGWRLGEEPFIGAAGSPTVSRAVRDLLVSPQTESVRTLARWGIGYLYAAGPVDPEVAAALDTAPGLVRSGAPSGDGAWVLDRGVGQVQTLDPGDETVGTGLPLKTAGDDGGPPWEVLLPSVRPSMVSLAAAPDLDWSAGLDGTGLRSTDATDVQTFGVGTGSDTDRDLLIEHRTDRPWWVAVQVAVLVVVVVLAAPTRRRRS